MSLRNGERACSKGLTHCARGNTYNDQKTLEFYRYIDAQLNSINNRLAAQDVRNQGVAMLSAR